MTTEEKSLLAVLTAAAVLVPVVLGTALDWPTWSWLLLAVPLLGVPGLVARNIRQRVQREELRDAYVTSPFQGEQQPQHQQTPVADVALPSALEGYDFHFSATACWRPAKGAALQHANLGGLAADAIITRAQAITAAERPSRVDVVAHRLAGALGAAQRDASGGMHAWADHVQLTLSEADRTRLRKLSDVPKDEDVWERERDHERRKRAYLGDDVLQSTGSAVVWWLAQHDNDVEGAVRLIGALAELSAAANDAEVPELFRHLVPPRLSSGSFDGDQQFPNGASHDGNHQAAGPAWAGFPAGQFPAASQFGAGLDRLNLGDDQSAHFAHRLARLIETAGKPEEAQAIRRRFDAPVADEQPAAIPDPDDELRDRPAPDEEPPLQEEPWRNSPLPDESEQDDDQQTDDEPRSEPLDEPRGRAVGGRSVPGWPSNCSSTAW